MKATPLSATCPRHLPCSCRTLTPTCPRTFKTAVCPASNPPNASAGLQGNNSYSYYMPLPSVFQGVQDCRLPALKPPKRFQRSRRPPRQQLLQLHAPAICFSGGSRLPFARPQNPPNASNAPAGLQGNNSYSYMSPNPPNASNPLAGLPGPAICFSGVQDCRLPALKPPKRFQRSRRPPRQQLLQLHVLKPSKRSQPSRRPPRQQLLQLHAPAICFSGGSRLPFARPQTPQTLPQASKATTLTATTCPCHLFFRGFKTAVCPPSNPPNASNPLAGLQGNKSYSYMPLPSVFQGVQDCRLPALKPPKRFRRPPRQQLLQLHAPAICFSGVQDCRLPALKPPKRFRRPPRQQLLQLHAPAICFSGGSRLPFARPQTPQTLPQASKATTLTATCLCHLFFRGFKTAVCPPSNPPNTSNPPAGLQGNNSDS